MRNYNITPVDPIGSATKGYATGLAFRRSNDLHNARKQDQEAFERDEEYRQNVTIPRNNTLWEQQQDQYAREVGQQEVGDEATRVFGAVRGLTKEAQDAALLGVSPEVAAKVSPMLQQENERTLRAIDVNMQHLQADTVLVDEIPLEKWPEFSQYLKERYPDITSKMNLDVKSDDELQKAKYALKMLTRESFRKHEYAKELMGPPKKPTPMTDKQRFDAVGQLREEYNNYVAMQPTSTGGFAGFGEKKAPPPLSFEQWAAQNAPRRYAAIYGGTVPQGAQENPVAANVIAKYTGKAEVPDNKYNIPPNTYPLPLAEEEEPTEMVAHNSLPKDAPKKGYDNPNTEKVEVPGEEFRDKVTNKVVGVAKQAAKDFALPEDAPINALWDKTKEVGKKIVSGTNEAIAGSGEDRIKSVLEENKEKPFVKRILAGGKESMTVSEVAGKYIVYPSNNGQEVAMKTDNYIEFDTAEEAEWFSKNYKNVWGE